MWKLYSLRNSASHGWQWQIEREAMSGIDADYWLGIYRRNEARVTFTISKSKRKPPLPGTRSKLQCAPTILGR